MKQPVLLGGFKDGLFSPRKLGKMSHFDKCFSDGLVQPPTSFFLFPDTFSKAGDEKDHPTQLSSPCMIMDVCFFNTFEGFEQGICSTLFGTLLGRRVYPPVKGTFGRNMIFKSFSLCVGDVSLFLSLGNAFDCKPSIL